MSEQVLPFYLVCDESGSMSGDPIDAINSALPELHREVSTNPVVADKTRFSMIGFSDSAVVVLDLIDLSDVSAMPQLTSKGGTSFGEAFRVLRQQIDIDVARLKSQGHRVFRPVVFFLSDGQPTDSWQGQYQQLVDPSNPYRPNIVAFGIGDADETVIAQVANFKAFKANGSMSPAAALNEFASSLTKSIVKSGSTVTQSGDVTLQVPESVPGFTALDLAEI